MNNYNLKKETLELNTVQKALAYVGIDSNNLPDVSSFPEVLREYMLNHFVVISIVNALNKAENDGKEWLPNYHTQETKYFPWPYVDASEEHPSGSGFSDSLCGYSCTFACVGSRLLFMSSDLALFALDTFNKEYVINQLIIK